MFGIAALDKVAQSPPSLSAPSCPGPFHLDARATLDNSSSARCYGPPPHPLRRVFLAVSGLLKGSDNCSSSIGTSHG